MLTPVSALWPCQRVQDDGAGEGAAPLLSGLSLSLALSLSLSHTQAVWALPLKLSSLNSAIYGAVVPERRQGFVFVLSVVCVLKGSCSNQHLMAANNGTQHVPV